MTSTQIPVSKKGSWEDRGLLMLQEEVEKEVQT
jgi:hypothetical protein